MNTNVVVMTGNLTRDPVIKRFESGAVRARLSVAVNSLYSVEGNLVSKPDFVSVEVWGSQAESCEKYLTKGRSVAISGRLETYKYQPKDKETKAGFVHSDGTPLEVTGFQIGRATVEFTGPKPATEAAEPEAEQPQAEASPTEVDGRAATDEELLAMKKPDLEALVIREGAEFGGRPSKADLVATLREHHSQVAAEQNEEDIPF